MTPLFWAPAFVQDAGAARAHPVDPARLLRRERDRRRAAGLRSGSAGCRRSSRASSTGGVGLGPVSYIGPNGQLIVRPPGLFDTPGAVAGPAAYAALLGLVFAVSAMPAWKRLLSLAFAGAGLAAIYLSQVRISLVVTLGMMIVYALVAARQGRVGRATQFARAGRRRSSSARSSLAVSLGGHVDRRSHHTRSPRAIRSRSTTARAACSSTSRSARLLTDVAARRRTRTLGHGGRLLRHRGSRQGAVGRDPVHRLDDRRRRADDRAVRRSADRRPRCRSTASRARCSSAGWRNAARSSSRPTSGTAAMIFSFTPFVTQVGIQVLVPCRRAARRRAALRDRGRMTRWVVAAGDFTRSAAWIAPTTRWRRALARSGRRRAPRGASRVGPISRPRRVSTCTGCRVPLGAHLLGAPRLAREAAAPGAARRARPALIERRERAPSASPTWIHYLHAAYRAAGRLGVRATRISALGRPPVLPRARSAPRWRRAPLVICNSARTRGRRAPLLRCRGIPAARRLLRHRTRDQFGPVDAGERAAGARRRSACRRAAGRALHRRARRSAQGLRPAVRRLADAVGHDPAWDVDLLVAGDGRRGGGVARARGAAGLGGRIRFLGFRRDVPRGARRVPTCSCIRRATKRTGSACTKRSAAACRRS